MTPSRSYRAAFRAGLLSCSALGTALIAAPAFAQAAGPDQGNTLTEIVVTAQKREQNLQDVPISITAVTQDVLRANRITNVQDLSALAPNMTVRPAAGDVGIPSISLRGIVSYGSVPGSDKEVSIYIDGVPIGSAQGSAFDLPDVERIEVLRGPQGTLFGRNATAGAINVITRNPSGRFGVRQELTYGNLNAVRSVTRIDLPAVGPLSASVSYVHDQHDGDIKNLGAGQVWDRSGPGTREGIQVSPKTLGAKNLDSWFVALHFDPSDNFSMSYKFDWMENHSTPSGTAVIGVDPTSPVLGPAGPLLAAAFNSNPVTFGASRRPDAVNNGFASTDYEQVIGHNVTATYRFNDHLSIKNILAYRQSFIYGNAQISGAGGLVVTPQVAQAIAQLAGIPAQFLSGLIGSPFVITDSQAQSSAKQWSDEIQVNYDSKYLTLTTGALYFHLDTVTGSPWRLPGVLTFTPVPGGVETQTTPTTFFNYAKSSAFYTQAEFHVLPNLDVVGGYRLTDDEKSGIGYVGTLTTNFSYSKTKPSYLLSVNYRPLAGILTYAKYSNGFVSGGAVGPVVFQPETVHSWEIGMKSDLLDKRLRLNLAAFTADYKNLQTVDTGINVGHPELGTVVVDQGNEKAKGVEGEFTFLPARGLSFNGGFGYTDVRFTSLNPLYGTVDTFLPTLRPKWTANLAGQYQTEPLFDEARLTVRIDADWHSRIRTYGYLPIPAIAAPIAFQPAAWIVNGRLALQDIRLKQGNLEVALWARNITNNRDVLFPIAFGNPPYLTATNYQQARTFGLDVIYNY